jgi:uncharacterized membrane protein
MSGMWGNMGGMMGGTSHSQIQNTALPFFGVAFVMLVAVAAVGTGGLAYYVAFPEIKNRVDQPAVTDSLPIAGQQTQKSACTPYESVTKTLSPEERKVVEIVKAHEGRYLQKYIRNEAGLSRLQIHRIVARLTERGIVSVEKNGNTNQVLLADWLKARA